MHCVPAACLFRSVDTESVRALRAKIISETEKRKSIIEEYLDMEKNVVAKAIKNVGERKRTISLTQVNWLI